MRSRIARTLAVLLLFAPMGASPLGLGEIELRSALNEQLDAEIELESLGRTQTDEITAGLASRAAFEQAGVERPLFLTRFDFEVGRRPDGTPYIQVTSDQPIKEPFLDFLVEVDWPSGHLIRAYTVLLDPPVFMEEEPAAVEAPTAGESRAAPAASGEHTAGAPETRRSGVAPAGVSRSSAVDDAPEGGLSYGPVQRSDTLWSIARELRPNDSVSIEQTMMALLKSNPEAFYDNNINQLKAGYVLRISDPALISEMSKTEAAAAARRQYEQWLDTKGRRAREAGQRPEGSGGGPAAQAGASGAGEAGPQLRLVVPEASSEGKALEGAARTTEAGAPERAEIDELREELAMALEQSEVARQENQDLRERLSVLEEQLESMQRLVTLKDDTLAALQSGAGDGRAAGAGATVPPAGDADGQATARPGDQASPAEATDSGAGQQSTPRQTAPAAVPPPDAQAGGGPRELLNQLMADPMWRGVAGAAILLLATLAWLIVRRRRAADESFAEMEQEVATASPEQEEAVLAAGAGAVAADTVQAEQADTFGETVEEAAETLEEAGLDIMQADEEEIDILAEADVYLAYRRFDKAEELLRDAIQAEPDRHELMIKLLEVYAASENKDAFILQAENLKASLKPGEDSVWEKAVAMGRQLAPDHALFGVSEGDAGGDEGVELAGEEGLDASLEADLEGLDLDVDLDAELEKLGGEDAQDDLFSGDTDVALEPFDGDQPGGEPDGDGADQVTAPAAEGQGLEEQGLSLEEPGASDELSAGGSSLDDADLALDEQTLSELGDLELEAADATAAEPIEAGAEEVGQTHQATSGEEQDEGLAFELDTGEDDTSGDGQAVASGPSGDGYDFELPDDAGARPDGEPEAREEFDEALLGDGAEMQNESPQVIDGEDLEVDGRGEEPAAFAELEETRLTGTDDAVPGATGEVDAGGAAAASRDTGREDWLADLGGDFPGLDEGEQDIDDEFSNLISGDDEVGTKLDLAKAYIDMGDQDSARSILSEVVDEGSEDQQREANELMQQIG